MSNLREYKVSIDQQLIRYICFGYQATRIAYGGNREFQRVVTLDGALFEKSGTMSGGGGKPRGGRMGTSIKATGVSGEVVANAEKELFKIVDMLSHIREKIGNAVRQYRAAENEVSRLEMELAKSQREVMSPVIISV